MNRRFLLRTGGITGLLLLLLVGAAAWKAYKKQRAFDPVAVALLGRNHRRMASLRSLSGTLVKTTGTSAAPGDDPIIADVRLLKPNHEHIAETWQQWRGGRLRTKPNEYRVFHSDGVKLRIYRAADKVRVPPAARMQTEAAQPHGENFQMLDPCLYGFFDAPTGTPRTPVAPRPQGTHFARVNYGRAPKSDVEFIRYDGRSSVHGVACEVVTYKRQINPYSPTALQLMQWSITARHRLTRYSDQTTLYIDADGLIRRAVLMGDVREDGGEVSEWRNVQVDPPSLTAADFRVDR